MQLVTKENEPLFQVLKKAIPGTLQKGQDAVDELYSNSVLAVALADGISSAGPLAGYGARAVVQAAVHFLTEKFDEVITADAALLRNNLYTLFRDYYLKKLNSLAQEHNLPLVLDGEKMIHQNFNKYSTTVLACAVKNEYLIVLKIGNGAIVANAGNGFGVVSPSKIIHGKTPGIGRIVDPGFADFTFERYIVPDLQALVLMSDGVEFPEAHLYNNSNDTLFEDFIEWFNSSIESDEKFSASMDNLGKIGKDDISVVIMIKPDVRFEESKVIFTNPLSDAELYCMRESMQVPVCEALHTLAHGNIQSGKDCEQPIWLDNDLISFSEVVPDDNISSKITDERKNDIPTNGIDFINENISNDTLEGQDDNYLQTELSRDISPPSANAGQITGKREEQCVPNCRINKAQIFVNVIDVIYRLFILVVIIYLFVIFNNGYKKRYEYTVLFNQALSSFLLDDHTDALEKLDILDGYDLDSEIWFLAKVMRQKINSEKIIDIDKNTQIEINAEMLQKSPAPDESVTDDDITLYDTIIFGGIEWYVLEEENGEKLLLSKNIIARGAFQDEDGKLTWENSSIRQYLNTEFYNSFSLQEQKQIVQKSIVTYPAYYDSFDGNSYAVDGGKQTEDKIFLLSVEEVEKFFAIEGDLTERENWWNEHYGRDVDYMERPYPTKLICIDGSRAMYQNEALWWWLRSPAYYENGTAVVDADGNIDAGGYLSQNQNGGVRPAMWIIVR